MNLGKYHNHTPQNPVMVPELMEKLVKECEISKLHPIEKATLFHLKFEGIHLFVDGNGRKGRLILNLLLMQNGYPPVNVKFAVQKRYYNAFYNYYKDNNVCKLVEIMVEYLEK